MTLDLFTGLINGLLPEPHAGLLNGILFGVKTTLNPDLQQSLLKSGTSYILAHSGMNISILVGISNLLLLRFVRRPIANLVSVIIIIGYVWLVGITPSVLRAALMAAISLAAVSLGRQNWTLLSWVLAVGIMLIINPLWIGDVSFQISVMATLGIIVFGGKKSHAGRLTILSTVTRRNSTSAGSLPMRAQVTNENLDASSVSLVNSAPTLHTLDSHSQSEAAQNFVSSPRGRAFSRPHHPPILSLLDGYATNCAPTKAIAKFIWSLIADDLRVTLAAQAFTIPIIIFQFHQISLVSPLSNILIGWLIAPVMALGFALVIGGLLWAPIGMIFAWIVFVPLSYIILVIDLTSKLPFASLSW